ncbi:RDD family protein [Salinicoccus albus]|uniref:RDD family protein n=1 Tax=Salinicoccus albus TaxID=418756 RepID=UPI00036FE1A2|nr:RDD family protein [Salinicoccus albus]
MKNPAANKTRLIALAIDYIAIVIYLCLLFITMMLLYLILFEDIPEFSEMNAHLISFVTTVLPVVLCFSIMEYKFPYGTVGKRKMNLKVIFSRHTYLHSLIRNTVKFLPWQIGHTGVIAGIYRDYSMSWFMFGNSGILLLLILAGMMILRKDRRHLGDMGTGTQVVER